MVLTIADFKNNPAMLQQEAATIAIRQLRTILAAIVLGASVLCILFLGANGPALADSHSDWRSKLKTFRVGILAGDDHALAMAEVEPFRKALQKELGTKVSIVPHRDYFSLIEAQANNQIEYAIMNASAMAVGEAKCNCLDPIATASNTDKSWGYHAVIIARKSGLKEIDGLKGGKLMVLSHNSIAGYHYPVWELERQGISLKASKVEIIAPPSAEQGLKEFISGEGNALMGWSTLAGNQSEGYSAGTLRQLARLTGENADNYTIIWNSSIMPYRTHVVRKDMDSGAKKYLRSFLLGLYHNDPVAYDAIEPVHGGGFVKALPASFHSLSEFMRNIKPTAKHNSGQALEDTPIANSSSPVRNDKVRGTLSGTIIETGSISSDE